MLQVRLPAIPLSGNSLGQVVHTRVSVTKQYNLVPVEGRWCPAAGKVTVGLASHWLCVRLKWFIHLQAYGLDRERSTPPTPSCGVWPTYHNQDLDGQHVTHLCTCLCCNVCARLISTYGVWTQTWRGLRLSWKRKHWSHSKNVSACTVL